jgi:hypothetical protein
MFDEILTFPPVTLLSGESAFLTLLAKGLDE